MNDDAIRGDTPSKMQATREYDPPRIEVFDRSRLIDLLGPVQMCDEQLPTSVDPGGLKNLPI